MREDKNETRWDKLLHIRTMGRDDSHSDQHRFPYEPTPYCVLELLKRVMGRILDSYYANPRRMQLFFYYPTDEYISYMMTVDELMYVDEIDCRDLFPGNDPRERIAIFGL